MVRVEESSERCASSGEVHPSEATDLPAERPQRRHRYLEDAPKGAVSVRELLARLGVTPGRVVSQYDRIRQQIRDTYLSGGDSIPIEAALEFTRMAEIRTVELTLDLRDALAAKERADGESIRRAGELFRAQHAARAAEALAKELSRLLSSLTEGVVREAPAIESAPRHQIGAPVVSDELDWRGHAECRGQATRGDDPFYPLANRNTPSHKLDVERAKAMCRRCPVLEQCLEWAIPNLKHGVAGGLTDDERAAARKKRGLLPPADPVLSDRAAKAAAGERALRQGMPNKVVAEVLGVSERVVTRWAAAIRQEREQQAG